MIAIANYGLGNVEAFANIYRRLGIPVTIATTAEELTGADKVILPGVGAFDWAMARLNESGMRQCLDTLVLQQRRPVLGVCVGMQMMMRGSEEGILGGLGWIDGEVRRMNHSNNGARRPLPHMGWNDVVPTRTDCLFKRLAEGSRFYFLHSYAVVPAERSAILAETEYGQSFASAVRARNVFGVQFHPEKSHDWGIALLRNFAEL